MKRAVVGVEGLEGLVGGASICRLRRCRKLVFVWRLDSVLSTPKFTDGKCGRGHRGSWGTVGRQASDGQWRDENQHKGRGGGGQEVELNTGRSSASPRRRPSTHHLDSLLFQGIFTLAPLLVGLKCLEALKVVEVRRRGRN